MSFVPRFEKILYCEDKSLIAEQIKVECKSDILTETVSKILSVSATSIVEKENAENSFKYVGKTVFYVCYLDSEGTLKKYECGSEFTGKFDGEENPSDTLMRAVTEKAEADLSGAKLVFTAYVTVSTNLEIKSEADALIGGENLITKRAEVETVKMNGKKCGAYPVEEDFELSYSVAEVLNHKADAFVTAVQCGVGTVIVDGEVYLSAILLQNGDKSDIIKENKTIPFRMEIEYEDAMPSFGATAFVSVKSFKTNITVDEDSLKSSVNVTASLCYEVEAFSCETAETCDDAFCIFENVKLERGEIKFDKPCGKSSESVKVFLRAPIDKLDVGERVVAVCNEKATVVSVKRIDDKAEITGALYFECLVVSDDGKYRVIKSETPFTVKTETCVPDCKLSACVYPTNTDSRIVSAEEIELSTDLRLIVECVEQKKISYIKSVTSDGEKQIPNSAVSVYIPVEGEELWSLSKRLNVCPEALLETNKDLEFPLSGKERIVVFRKK